MNKLKAFLDALHQGERVVLEERENQESSLISVDYLTFQDGEWRRSTLNCWSSSDFGFGTCRCNSHPAFRTERVNRKTVLEELRKLLRRETEDKVARQAEIAWLEEQLKAL